MVLFGYLELARKMMVLTYNFVCPLGVSTRSTKRAVCYNYFGVP